jgi:hypothetical protein
MWFLGAAGPTVLEVAAVASPVAGDFVGCLRRHDLLVRPREPPPTPLASEAKRGLEPTEQQQQRPALPSSWVQPVAQHRHVYSHLLFVLLATSRFPTLSLPLLLLLLPRQFDQQRCRHLR